MPVRVTMRAVAAEVGVSVSTVSKALRHDPRIPPDTCARIAEAARRLGYVPDPGLAALAAYRSAAKPPKETQCLAWVRAADAPAWTGRLLEGARERAAASGYRIVEYVIDPALDAGEHLARLRRLRARGGLAAPLPQGSAPLPLPTEGLAWVALSFSVDAPALHVATVDHVGGMWRLLDAAWERGWRRVGLMIPENLHLRSRRQLPAATREWQAARGAVVEPLVLSAWQPARVREWLAAQRPDAIAGYPELVPALRDLGLRVPEDLGYAGWDVDPDSDLAGMVMPFPEIGAAAVDLLHAALVRGEAGLPERRRITLVEPRWRDGPQLPRR